MDARGGRADLFVAVDEHRDRAVVAEIQRLEHRERVQDDGDAVPVVGDSEAVSAVAVDAERLLRKHAARVNRIHVGEEQDLFRAGARESRSHHLADLLGRVVHLVDVARLHELDLPTQIFQPPGDEACEFVQAVVVTAARLDGHQFLQGSEQAWLFLLGQGRYRLDGLAECVCRHARPHQEHGGLEITESLVRLHGDRLLPRLTHCGWRVFDDGAYFNLWIDPHKLSPVQGIRVFGALLMVL